MFLPHLYASSVFNPRSLFAQGQEGFILSPRPPYIYETSAGTTQVTAGNTAFGLLLDSKTGAARGPELWDNTPELVQTGWTDNGDGSYTCDGTNGVLISKTMSAGELEDGECYEITYEITEYTSGSFQALLYGGDDLGLGQSRSAAGAFREVIRIDTSTGTTSDRIRFWSAQSFVGTVGNISVKSIPGNYAIQSVSADRPIYRTADGKHWATFNLTNQSLTIADLPAGTYAVAFAGLNGTWFDEIVHAGGDFDIGVTTYTGGPEGMLEVLGGMLGVIVREGAFTESEISQVTRYCKSLGSPGVFELGPELVTNGTFDAGIDGWSSENSAILGWDSDLQALSVERVSSASSRASTTLASEVPDGVPVLLQIQHVGGSTIPFTVRADSTANQTTFFDGAISTVQRAAFTTVASLSRILPAPNSNASPQIYDNISVRKLELVP